MCCFYYFKSKSSHFFFIKKIQLQSKITAASKAPELAMCNNSKTNPFKQKKKKKSDTCLRANKISKVTLKGFAYISRATMIEISSQSPIYYWMQIYH